MNLKGEKKRFIYNGIILMMLCLTVLVVFKSNVFAADSARTSYVGASGCTLVFQKEWDDGGAVSDRPKSITFLVDLADTNRPGGSSSPPTEKVSITLNAENNWTYTYPKVDYKTYGYIPESVKELAVDGYEYTGETVKWEGKDAGGYGGTVTVTLNNKKKVATGNLTVTKEVAGTHGDKDKEFHFTVTLDDKTISGKFGDMDFTDGVATFTLKHGQSATATGLPAGIGYTVKETEANQNGYVTTSTADKGTVSENGNAEIRFTNTKSITGNLKVTKEVAGTHGDKDKEFHFTVTLDDKTISGKFGDMDFTDGVATFTLKHGQSATATGLPAGIGYTVKETEANQNGYVTTSTADKGTVSENGNAEIRFTNTKSITGNLKVTKEVAGTHGDKDKEFHFTVTLDDKTISGKFGDMDFTDGVATFTLKHGQSATATGLPAGIGYTVKETEANQNGYVTTSTADKGTVSENGNAEIRFTNTKSITGNLKVTKEVAGTHGDKDKEFHFTVTLDDKTISGKFGDMDFTDGVATFTLKHGQSATATGLPAGNGYTVKETEANQNGYVTTSTADKGTVSENGNAEIRFTNTKSITGNLKVTKEVAGTHGDKEKEFHFTVTLDDKTISGKFGDMDFTDGVATFTLKHGQSATATGLPAGNGYTVKETEANQNGYVTTSTADKGTVPENGNAEIRFTNTKSITGNLKVTKEVAGTHGDKEKEFHFTVTLDDKTISGKFGDMDFTDGVATFTLKHGQSATATGLPAGIGYTVKETEANQNGYVTTSTADKGTVSENGNAEIRFTNTKSITGNLKVTKEVAGTHGDKEKEFHFTVTLDDKTISGKFGDMDFTDGVATFTLKHGQSATATGLPAGIGYTVKETEANQNGYVTTSTADKGTVSENGNAEIRFTNTKSITGNLKVTKEVAGTHGDKEKEFHFTVTLDDKTISGKFGDMDFTDGVATFTLKHGQSATATGLPAGIGYTVKETEANQDGYVTTSTADKGTVPENGNVEIKFINHKEVTSEKPSTPDKSDTLDSPKTGDRTNIELYISLYAMSGLLIAILTVLKKKKILKNR